MTYATAGTYTITLTVTDNGGLTATDQATVTVGAGVPGAPTGLTASGSGSGVALDWADTSGATGYNVYRSDAANGTYTKLTTTAVTTSAYTDATAPVGDPALREALTRLGHAVAAGGASLSRPR